MQLVYSPLVQPTLEPLQQQQASCNFAFYAARHLPIQHAEPPTLSTLTAQVSAISLILEPIIFREEISVEKMKNFRAALSQKIRIPLQFSSSPFFIQNFKRGVQCSEDQNAFAQILSYIYFLLCKYVAHFPQILKQNLFHQMIFYILQLATKIFRPSGVSVFKVYIF